MADIMLAIVDDLQVSIGGLGIRVLLQDLQIVERKAYI